MTAARATSRAVTFYDAKVFHARLRPHAHRFTYSVLSLVLDLDRLAEANEASPLFSVGRLNLLSFRPKDHGPRDGSDLRAHADALLLGNGCARPARVLLLCMPRIAGLGFNPLSVYYCLDAEDRLSALIYEVRNTFGEHHSYVVRAATDGMDTPPHDVDKIFYVSPFMDMALRYRFLTQAPGETVSLKIIERDTHGVVLTALLSGKVFEANFLSLLRRALSSPLLGVKVMAGIHWEALRLWLKGHRLRPRPAPPDASSFDKPGPFSQSHNTQGSP